VLEQKARAWTVDCGLWTVDCGPWTVAMAFESITACAVTIAHTACARSLLGGRQLLVATAAGLLRLLGGHDNPGKRARPCQALANDPICPRCQIKAKQLPNSFAAGYHSDEILLGLCQSARPPSWRKQAPQNKRESAAA
jgi:hypothetical protein